MREIKTFEIRGISFQLIPTITHKTNIPGTTLDFWVKSWDLRCSNKFMGNFETTREAIDFADNFVETPTN